MREERVPFELNQALAARASSVSCNATSTPAISGTSPPGGARSSCSPAPPLLFRTYALKAVADGRGQLLPGDQGQVYDTLAFHALAAFVAINTVVCATLSLAKLIPKRRA